MTDLEIILPAGLEAETVPTAVEEVCMSADLHLMMKTTLKKYPGCLHWHFKKGRERGILELTWWPSETDNRAARLWLSVHGNRAADWMAGLTPQIKVQIEARLARGASQVLGLALDGGATG